jgi:ankyrin repeat protein
MKLLSYITLIVAIFLGGCSAPDGSDITTKNPAPERKERRTVDRSTINPAPGSFYAAAADGDLDSVKMMLEDGQDINARDKDGVTALAWASIRGRVDVARYLIEQKADPVLSDHKGLTPLHKACLFGNKDIIQLLIDAGADVNAEGPQGVKPLTIALRMNHIDAITLLESAGAVAE